MPFSMPICVKATQFLSAWDGSPPRPESSGDRFKFNLQSLTQNFTLQTSSCGCLVQHELDGVNSVKKYINVIYFNRSSLGTTLLSTFNHINT